MRELQTILSTAVTRLSAIALGEGDDAPTLADFAAIISEDKGDIDKEISKAVATLGKVAVFVALKSASTESPNAPGPVIDAAEIFVEISENVLLNRRGTDGTDYLTALDVAQIVCSTDLGLHQYRDATTGLCYLASGEFLKPSPPPPGATTAYTLSFKTTGLMAGSAS